MQAERGHWTYMTQPWRPEAEQESSVAPKRLCQMVADRQLMQKACARPTVVGRCGEGGGRWPLAGPVLPLDCSHLMTFSWAGH